MDDGACLYYKLPRSFGSGELKRYHCSVLDEVVFEDTWEIMDNFSYFSLKPYVVTPHLNRLDETVRMRVIEKYK